MDCAIHGDHKPDEEGRQFLFATEMAFNAKGFDLRPHLADLLIEIEWTLAHTECRQTGS